MLEPCKPSPLEAALAQICLTGLSTSRADRTASEIWVGVIIIIFLKKTLVDWLSIDIKTKKQLLYLI